MDELQNQQNQPQWQQSQDPQMKESFSNKKVIIIVAIILALLFVGLGIWYVYFVYIPMHTPYMPSTVLIKPPLISEQDTTSAINNELNSINVESVDDSFKEIDSDLNSL